MAQAKPEVKRATDTETGKVEYQVQQKNAKGDTITKDKADAFEPMPVTDAVMVFVGLAKDAPNKRVAACTLLYSILKNAEAMLGAWKGGADKEKGIPNELKTAFQTAEDAFFRAYMDDKHPDHKRFIGRLPMEDGRGNALQVLGKPNMEARFQAFVTNTRKEPSYGNAKNVVLGAYCYLGMLPMDEESGKLIPPEILRVMVENAKIAQRQDNSFKARIMALYREITAEAKTPGDDELPEALATARSIVEVLTEYERAAAMRRSARPQTGQSVKASTDAAIAQAQASTGRVEPQPTGKAKKAGEPATA